MDLNTTNALNKKENFSIDSYSLSLYLSIEI